MGVVYAAEDLRLKRRVALKFIPQRLLDNKQYRIRFLREAQAAAALHHPNICTVFDLDEENGFLAMELISGPNLSDKIRERPLKLEDALRIAMEIAEALRAAHAAGVVHRDVKSNNVLLTRDGHAKLTDFGLATLADWTRVTMTGTAVGTPGYLSPEQARGEPSDRRSDLWAIGVVLYEMVAGRLPFPGESAAGVVHAVIHGDPEPLTAVRAGLPVELDGIIAKCLAKEPAERYQYADDLLVDLRRLSRPSSSTITAVSARNQRAPWILVFALAIALIGSLAWNRLTPDTRHRVPAAPFRQFVLETEFDQVSDAYRHLGAKISPDGTKVAFPRAGAIWIRDLDRTSARKLPGTEGGEGPFWSPDSSSVAFVAGGALKKISVASGEPVLLSEAPPASFLGGSWGGKGMIVVAFAGGPEAGLYKVSGQGGPLQLVLKPSKENGEQDFHGPVLLPDGESILYVIHAALGFGMSLGAWKEGAPKSLGVSGASVDFDANGYIVFERLKDGSSLFSAPFSPSRMELTGDPRFLLGDAGAPSLSSTGDLLSSGGALAAAYELVLLDRGGKVIRVLGASGVMIRAPSLSSDGRVLAFTGSPESKVSIWTIDMERGNVALLDGGDGRQTSPVWLKGDQQVAYIQGKGQLSSIIVQRPGGTTPEVLVREPELGIYDPPTFSPDGNYVVYQVQRGQGADLMLARLDKPGLTRPWLATPAREANPRISPDGRYLAYTSNESGRYEVYVRRFPDGHERWQISASGGAIPRWSSRGDELFYVWDNTLYSATVRTGTQLQATTPRVLFRGNEAAVHLYTFVPTIPSYEITPDARGIIAVRRKGADRARINFTQNWRALLDR